MVHPRELHPERPREEVLTPHLCDIAGSASWANKTDAGVTLRAEDGVAQIYLTKMRLQEWGRRGAVADLEFNQRCGLCIDVAVPVPK